MSYARGIILACSVLALAGCGLGSVNATLSDADSHFSPDLLGTWQAPDSSEWAVITADDKGGYIILCYEKGNKPGRFLARAGRIAGRRVLDVQPDAAVASENESYKALVLPLHTVLYLDTVTATEVRFRALEPDSVNALLQRQPTSVAHIVVDDHFVLTAATPDVQKFVASLAARPGVFQDATVWLRRSTASPN